MTSGHADLLLVSLAARRLVVASTQNQALNTLVCLFRDAIKNRIGKFILTALTFHQCLSILVHRD